MDRYWFIQIWLGREERERERDTEREREREGVLGIIASYPLIYLSIEDGWIYSCSSENFFIPMSLNLYVCILFYRLGLSPM